MHLKICPLVIFRIPQFPITARLEDCWDELKQSIALSSNSFYPFIADVTAEQLESLPPKVYHTIWKYFNRAKYRCTPYGTFAGFGLVHTSTGARNTGIVVEDEQQIHKFKDWIFTKELDPETLFRQVASENGTVLANTSHYQVGGNLRYISNFNGSFQLSEVSYDPVIFEILNFCKQPVSYNQVITQIAGRFENAGEASAFIGELIGAQLLITGRHPNIIGMDYFQRLEYKPEDTDSYIIAERNLISGAIATNELKNIPELIEQLQKTLPIPVNGSMKEFREHMLKKFENREIPLLTALDPETGVGYGNLAHRPDNDDLAQKIMLKMPADEAKSAFDFQKAVWAKLWGTAGHTNIPLQLHTLALPELEAPLMLPNSLSLIVTKAEGLLWLDHLGGVTANSLNGRFTIASNEVHRHCIQVANEEAEANPDVLFFDIAYSGEPGVDNINRRGSIYPYQLSILNMDMTTHPLSLNDLTVGVSGPSIILRSKSLNCRLVPRIASSYNHVRSDLAIFRFLSDLQYQGLCAGLNFSLEAMLPGLDFYPRVQFKNLVLSPAKWRLEAKHLQNIDQTKAYLAHLGVSRFFKFGTGDQTLCIDSQSTIDITAFLAMLQKQDSLVVEESADPQQSVVRNRQGHSYAHQFIFTITQKQKNYTGIRKGALPDSKIKEVILPGGEWLYFEIYCHPQRSDELLLDTLASFLLSNSSKVQGWFFIRYHENGDHLRFRVRLWDAMDGYVLIKELSRMIAPQIDNGTVADFQLKTYRREMERYAFAGIEEAEAHFHLDSKYVLEILKADYSTIEKYRLCASIFETVLESGLFTLENFQSLINLVSDIFKGEHHLPKETKNTMNLSYRVFRATPMPLLDADQQEASLAYQRSVIDLLQRCIPAARDKLFSDLVHMHVNRLFSDKQRTHEMILYHYLVKETEQKRVLSETATKSA